MMAVPVRPQLQHSAGLKDNELQTSHKPTLWKGRTT